MKTILAAIFVLSMVSGSALALALGDVSAFFKEAGISPAPATIGAAVKPAAGAISLNFKSPLKITLPTGAIKGSWDGYNVNLAPDGKGGVKGSWNGYNVNLAPDGKGAVKGSWNGYNVNQAPNMLEDLLSSLFFF